MPSWKKVVVSGSSPTLNDITLSGDAKIAATKKLYFDGGSHTYIHESADDILEIVVGGEVQLKLTEAGNGVEIPVDSHPLKIGAGSDLQFTHNGTNSFIENYTGALFLDNKTSDQDIYFKVNDGGVTTTALQIDASDNSRVKLPNDNQRLSIGASDDIQITHDGTNSYFDNYTGDLIIKNNEADKDIILKSDDGSGGETAYITLDGSTTTVEVAKNLNVSANISGSQIEASGDVIAFSSSDRELKDNITYIHNPLDKINKIGGYKFTWNDKQDTYLGKDVGVLAQEIEAVLPEVVTTRATGYKAVKYEKIVPLLIEGIKELDKKIKHIERNCDCLNK